MSNMDDLVPMAEALRKVQAQCNAYQIDENGTRNHILAGSWTAWGELHRAMVVILREWYHVAQGVPPALADRMASRVLDEVYDNGESIAYNMRLLAEGVIELGDPT